MGQKPANIKYKTLDHDVALMSCQTDGHELLLKCAGDDGENYDVTLMSRKDNLYTNVPIRITNAQRERLIENEYHLTYSGNVFANARSQAKFNEQKILEKLNQYVLSKKPVDVREVNGAPPMFSSVECETLVPSAVNVFAASGKLLASIDYNKSVITFSHYENGVAVKETYNNFLGATGIKIEELLYYASLSDE